MLMLCIILTLRNVNLRQSQVRSVLGNKPSAWGKSAPSTLFALQPYLSTIGNYSKSSANTLCACCDAMLVQAYVLVGVYFRKKHSIVGRIASLFSCTKLDKLLTTINLTSH